jgi:hypothetical protein
MRKFIIAASIAALAVVPTVASAADFNAATGAGFVGKGEIQTPFGWNDQKLQSKAGGVTFTYDKTTAEDWAVTCEWDTSSEQGKDHQVVIKHHEARKSADVDAAVAYDVKSGSRINANSKVTGFKLMDKDNVIVTSSGDVIPAVGDACLGNGQGTINPHITEVTLLSSSSTERLMAHYKAGGLHTILNWPYVAPVVVA